MHLKYLKELADTEMLITDMELSGIFKNYQLLSQNGL